MSKAVGGVPTGVPCGRKGDSSGGVCNQSALSLNPNPSPSPPAPSPSLSMSMSQSRLLLLMLGGTNLMRKR